MSTLFRFVLTLALAAGAAASSGVRADDYADPPSRVARMSYLRGDVSFSPAGENDWVVATLNRPLIRGDRLWTDRDARAELQLGSAALRMDERTSLQLLNLDDRTTQVELTQGTLNLRVRRLYQDQVYEVDTPTLAFAITRPGQYRIDVDPQGRHTTVAVWDGGGTAYGDHANFPVRDGEAIRFFDPALRDYEVYDIPRPDDFDRFCLDRDERLDRAVALRYVPEDMVGYSDLDDYGTWSEVHEYGAVWYPTRVSATWAPYRDGRWIWQEPWGWTWVDNAPWGFAPFHYGRWAYVGSRWGWVPGPSRVRPVYAPALVAFVGGNHWSVGVAVGGAAPIGWFPLGPREVYCPPYRVSRNYFTSVNVTNTVVNNTYITNVYNDYSSGRALTGLNYAYRGNPQALTAVPANVFVNARPVNDAVIRVDREMAARAEVARVAAIAPVQRSVIGGAAAAQAVPQRAVLERGVVARSAPPPATTPFAAREQALQRNPGRPLDAGSATPLTNTRSRGAAETPERVRIVGNGEAVNTRSAAPAPARGERIERDRGGETPARNEPVLRTPREAAPQRDAGERPSPRGEGLPSRSYRNGVDAGERPTTAPRASDTAPVQERGVQGRPARSDLPARDEVGDRGGRDAAVTRPADVRRSDAAPREVERTAPRQDVERAAPRARDAIREPELRREAPARRAEPVERPAEPIQERRIEQRAEPRVEPRVERRAAEVREPVQVPQREVREVREAPPQQQRAPAPQRTETPARERKDRGDDNRKKDDN
ncbi:MAG TPA: hypothetical protein PLN91_05735 [Rhodanobacteraceae bacterium]|nr:hypothetical protein [Rhodanobacteraceae bacterium]